MYDTEPWPATSVLDRLLKAVADKNVPALGGLLSSDLKAVVPLADPGAPIDKAALLSWLASYIDDTGTMRLDPAAVMHGSPDSVGAVVTHTAFKSPPSDRKASKGDGDGGPYWFTLPTICAANSDASGTELDQFFFITDASEQANRSEMIAVIRGWYAAYVGQDVEGFMAPLAEDVIAYSYNDYEQPNPVSKSDYHTGFLKWCRLNRKGGYIVTDAVANGSYVGVSVQFLTEVRVSGQQKMTNEIHIIELDDDLKMCRAYFYETNRCGYPASPCGW